jgi:hypothetical protein
MDKLEPKRVVINARGEGLTEELAYEDYSNKAREMLSTRKESKAESFAAEHYILKNEDEEIIIQMTDDWTTIDNATEIIEMLVDESWEDWSSNPLEGEVGEGDKDLVIHFQDNEGNILRTRGYHVKGNRANDTIIQWFSDYDYPIGGY